MWPRRRRFGLDARDFNLGGHEVSRVVRLETGLGVGAVHGGGLLQAEIGLQGEACARFRAGVSGRLVH